MKYAKSKDKNMCSQITQDGGMSNSASIYGDALVSVKQSQESISMIKKEIEKLFEGQNERIGDLEKQIETIGSQKEKEIDKGIGLDFYLKIFLVLLASSIIFWILAIVSAKCFGFWINNEIVIITIIGILATFIVVGNYAQIKEIEGKFERKHKDSISEIKSFTNKFDKISREVKKINDRLDQHNQNFIEELLSRDKINEYSNRHALCINLLNHKLIGMTYENVDIKKAVSYYLRAIQYSLGLSNGSQGILIIETVIKFLM
jgi:hypothetical protein